MKHRKPWARKARAISPLTTEMAQHYRSHSVVLRRTQWAAAREVRASLRPIRKAQEVAEQLGITKQAVEQIELRALTKILRAFRKEIPKHMVPTQATHSNV